MFSLPCRYVRIDCTKGKFNPQKMKIYGIFSENIETIFGKNTFKLLVNQPQKILYDL